MMTDSAVKTPKKRKSGEGLPPSGKKQKLNGVQQKPKTPQATPNKDGPKKLGKFAGTAALKNFNQQKQKSSKNKNADGAEANNKEKIAKKNRKRNSAFKSLTGIINEGNDSAKKDAIAKIEDKIKAIENRDEKSKSAQRKLKFLKRLKNRAEGKAPAPVQQNAEKTNKTKARRDRKNKLKKLGEGEQNIQEKQGQKKGGKAVKQQVVQKTEEESSEESDEQEAVASPPKAQKGKAKQKPQQKKNVPQAQDESDDGEEDESDAEGEEESGEEEESGSEVEGEEDENDDEEEGDAEEGSDDEESEEEPAPKPIQVGKNKPNKRKNK